jgi:hypothetical protein
MTQWHPARLKRMLKADIISSYFTDLYYNISLRSFAVICLQYSKDQYSVFSVTWFRRNVDMWFFSSHRFCCNSSVPWLVHVTDMNGISSYMLQNFLCVRKRLSQMTTRACLPTAFCHNKHYSWASCRWCNSKEKATPQIQRPCLFTFNDVEVKHTADYYYGFRCIYIVLPVGANFEQIRVSEGFLLQCCF